MKASRSAEQTSGDHSGVEPPDSIPNSEVKRARADGSATKGRVRVGRRQFLLTRIGTHQVPVRAFLFWGEV